MKLPVGADFNTFMELRFKEGSWERNGIPAEGCRVRSAMFEQIMNDGGAYDVGHAIYGLMDWLDVTEDPEPALATLTLILNRHFPTDGRMSARCHFQDEREDERIFYFGPIDKDQDVIAWQRRGWIMALAQPSQEEPGRIMVGAPGPISLQVAQRIFALGITTLMLEPFDSYFGAQAMSRSTSAVYAWEAGEVTTCHWQYGLGKRLEGDRMVDCTGEIQQPPADGWLPPNQLAMQVAIAAGYVA